MKPTTNPAIEEKLLTLRESATKTKDFREALEKLGEYLGIEIAKDMQTEQQEVTSLLGCKAYQSIIKEKIALVTILRAGLPLYQGLQKTFQNADAGFIGAMRNELTLKSEITYIALPDLENKTVILADTMIATGGSIVDVLTLLEGQGIKKCYVAAAIASRQGVNTVLDKFPNCKIYVAAIDPILNKKGYIEPGLGDAGDRCYGKKLNLI